MAEGLTPAELLEIIVARAAQLVGTDHGYVYIATPDGSELLQQAGRGVFAKHGSVRLSPGEGLAGAVFATGEPLAVDEYDAWSNRSGRFPPGLVGAMVGVPLRSGGKVLGSLGLAHPPGSGRVFGAEDLRMLSQLAQLASVALDEARLLAREHAALEQAERLLAAAHALGATRDLSQVLDGILRELKQVVPYDSASVQQLRDGRILHIVGGAGFTNIEEHIGHAIPVDSPRFPNTEVITQRRPLILKDAPSRFPHFAEGPHAVAPIRSWLGVPLLFGDQVIGMLTLDKCEADFYTPEHGRVAMAFAVQAASVLENARLFQELQRSEVRYRELIERASDMIYLLDTAGRFTYLNPTTERLFGFSEQELIGRQFLEFVLPDWRERAAAFYMDQYFNLVAQTYYELPFLTKSGREAWLGCSVQLLLADDGTPAAFQAINRDVTERKRAERLRDDLTHTLVHDLRNPLTPALGFLELLQLSPEALSPAQREMLDISIRGTRQVLDLVGHILDVARLEEGELPVERECVALAPLVQAVLEMQKPTAASKELQLSSSIDSSLPAVWADVSLLRRVLQNLVGNAVKFAPRGGRVQISAGRATVESVQVSVTDDGPGIPAQTRARLFEKFGTGRTAASGSGLGLAFCRLAIEAHGGRIWAEPDVGSGAILSFTLSIATATSP
jgi:PAS domain S-box-containing protein